MCSLHHGCWYANEHRLLPRNEKTLSQFIRYWLILQLNIRATFFISNLIRVHVPFLHPHGVDHSTRFHYALFTHTWNFHHTPLFLHALAFLFPMKNQNFLAKIKLIAKEMFTFLMFISSKPQNKTLKNFLKISSIRQLMNLIYLYGYLKINFLSFPFHMIFAKHSEKEEKSAPLKTYYIPMYSQHTYFTSSYSTQPIHSTSHIPNIHILYCI